MVRRYKRYKKRVYKPKYKKKLTRAQKLTGDKGASGIMANSTVQAAWKALRVANQIRQVINVEKKYLDNQISDNVGTTKGLNIVNVMSKGDDHDDREGDSILMQSIHHKGAFIIGASDHITFKMWYVLDKETKGALPAVTDIWDATAPTGYGMFDMRNRDNSDRFVILKEYTCTCASGGREIVPFDHFIKLGVHTKYLKDSNVGTIADIADNALLIVVQSTEATNTGSIRSSWRLTYTDN